MNKSLPLTLALIFLMAACMITVQPANATVDQGNSWVGKAAMPTAREYLRVAVVDGKIYAMGGNAGDGDLATNEEYDPATNAWVSKASMPIPSSRFVAAVYQNRIYCLGAGINEVYDPANNSWENKTPLHILLAQANVVDDKIYVMGGYPNYTSNQVYDPATDNWTTKAPMPKAGAVSASTVLNGKIYFFGSIYEGGGYLPISEWGYRSLTEIYDPATDSWSFGVGSPTFFGEASAVATSGLIAPRGIYLFDHPLTDAGVRGPFYTNQIYDAVNDSWAVGANMTSSRQGFGVAIVNDVIYVIGGYTQAPLIVLTRPDSKGRIYGGGATTYYDTVEAYMPIGYGTVPPAVAVASPVKDANYSNGNVSLVFSLNKPVNWSSYSLDGKDNITVTGNSTLAGLTYGFHNITVYAEDSFGNIGASETITFTVTQLESEPFPTLPVAAAAVIIAVVCVGLFLYFRKHKS